jgi:hypothetical protein
MRGLGIARAALVGVAGAALVLGATRLDGTVDLGPTSATAVSDQSQKPTTVPVAQTGLLCPGPERLGVSGGLKATQRVTALAAAAPDAALPAEARSSAEGTLRAHKISDSGQSKAHARESKGQGTSGRSTSSLDLDAAGGVLFLAGGDFAPGAAAMQYSLVREGDGRALTTVACGQPQAHSWLVAGGAQAGRLERVVLVNPAANAVTVDLQVLGAHGKVASESGRGVVVPPRGRTAVLLDSIAGLEKTPVVQVTAHGGEVYAAINDTWLDGVVARGGDTARATAAPSREQVIAGVSVDGSASLRVAVPGDAQAVVQTRVLTTEGPRRVKHDVVRVGGHSARDIDLSDLPAGTYAIQVRADVPVVAAATVEHGRSTGSKSKLDRKATDLAWTPSSAAVEGLAGTPLPPAGRHGLTNALTLTSTGAKAPVSVTTVDANGKATTRRFVLAADAVRSVPLESATSVWVGTDADSVHAAVLTTAEAEDDGPLVAALPLVSSPLVATQAPIRQVDG